MRFPGRVSRKGFPEGVSRKGFSCYPRVWLNDWIEVDLLWVLKAAPTLSAVPQDGKGLMVMTDGHGPRTSMIHQVLREREFTLPFG